MGQLHGRGLSTMPVACTLRKCAPDSVRKSGSYTEGPRALTLPVARDLQAKSVPPRFPAAAEGPPDAAGEHRQQMTGRLRHVHAAAAQARARFPARRDRLGAIAGRRPALCSTIISTPGDRPLNILFVPFFSFNCTQTSSGGEERSPANALARGI
jgi:hypothetical protein